MSNHGPQFDEFHGQSGFPHGGNLFDDGFGMQRDVATSHGQLFDQFATRPGVERYGERFDEFGWKEMPTLHGVHYDQGFDSPTMGDGEHGTWFDFFRGGARGVRYLAEGADYEGTVIDCDSEHLKVLSREGKEHEVLISQLLAYRADAPFADAGEPSREGIKDAHPGHTDTSVIGGPQGEVPSTHSHTARGGGHRTPVNPDVVNTLIANKSDADPVDVEKAMRGVPKARMDQAVRQHVENLDKLGSGNISKGSLKCPGCGSGSHYDVGHKPYLHKQTDQVRSKMFGSCRGCGLKHEFSPPEMQPRSQTAKLEDDDTDVEKAIADAGRTGIESKIGYSINGSPHCPGCAKAKSGSKPPHEKFPAIGASTASGHKCATCKKPFPTVGKSTDSSETATQQQDLDGDGDGDGGGKQPWCSHCKHVCKNAKDGKCPTCGGKVIYKTEQTSIADVTKSLAELAGVGK